MAILNERTLECFSHSVEQTERLGVRLGELLQPYDLICLSGDLGAGKTTFTRGLGRGWGTALRITSPTFTLINEYPRARDNRILYHVDSYRLAGSAGTADEDDVETMGLTDILYGDGAVVIEWAERLRAFLPQNYLWITLRHIDDTRRSLWLEATGARSLAILQAFRHSAFGI